MSSTITIQNVVNFASTQTALMPLAGVGGVANEPALTLVNDTLQDLIAKFNWKFNRVDMPAFALMRGRQDYNFAGACAFGLDDAKGVGIDLVTNNGVVEVANTVTVKFLETHNFSVGDTMYMTGNTVAAYNSVFTQTPNGSAWSGGWTVVSVPSTTSVTFTHATSGLAPSGSAGITDVYTVESGTMVTATDANSPQSVSFLRAVRLLQPASLLSVPAAVAVMSDNGSGVLKIRVNPLPGSSPWMVNLTYQKKPVLKTALSDTWAPFPDEDAFAFRQMFLAHAYRYMNSPRSEVEYQKALAAAQTAAQNDDSELSEEYIVPQFPLMTGNGWGL